jgi:hypothetical protein
MFGRRWIGRPASPWRIAEKWSRTGTFRLRQLSTTERIAVTFGPACRLPMGNPFFRAFLARRRGYGQGASSGKKL